jgi:hypothetical protein
MNFQVCPSFACMAALFFTPLVQLLPQNTPWLQTTKGAIKCEHETGRFFQLSRQRWLPRAQQVRSLKEAAVVAEAVRVVAAQAQAEA